MKAFGLKICLFLFLIALFSGRMSPLGTLTGALTGTILLWPLYQRVLPVQPHRKAPAREVAADEDPVRTAVD
ncbi:MAG TPA: hypothetical protein VIY49_03950 [Bryobacteraceae bacterium]